MCLAIPGKILSINETLPEMAMASVDFGGIVKNICVQYVEAHVGDYVLVHAGIAISVIDPQLADETIRDIERLANAADTKIAADEVR